MKAFWTGLPIDLTILYIHSRLEPSGCELQAEDPCVKDGHYPREADGTYFAVDDSGLQSSVVGIWDSGFHRLDAKARTEEPMSPR